MTPTEALHEKADALLPIYRYVNSPAFQAVLAEFYSLERDDREQFVDRVLRNPDALARRGAAHPPDLFISTSEFHDGRPTAFAICKYLPDGQRRMTVTFDHELTGKRKSALA